MPQIHLPQPKSWLPVNGEAQYPITVGYFSLPWVCTQVRSVKNQRRLKFPDYFRGRWGEGWVPRVTQPNSMGELMPCVVNFDQSETGTSRQNPLHSFPIWSFPHMVGSQSLSGSYLTTNQLCLLYKAMQAFPLTLALRLHLPIKALLVAEWALHSSFLGNHV